jgi:hypothetical protein
LDKIPTTTGVEKLSMSMEVPTNIGSYDNHQMRAWFEAPETTRYRFYMTCDDICDLRFSSVPDSDSSTDVKVIMTQNSPANYREYFRNRTGLVGYDS